MTKRIARYLRGKPRVVYNYKRQSAPNELIAHTDTNWAGCIKTRKSTSSGGIMFGPRSVTPDDGFDNQMATNYFGHFLLSSLLLKTLRSTSASENLETRIVNVSSAAHFCGGFIDVNDLNFRHFYSSHHAYCVSKACQIMFTKKLARVLKEQGCEKVIVNSIHPGIVRTDLLSNEWYLKVD